MSAPWYGPFSQQTSPRLAFDVEKQDHISLRLYMSLLGDYLERAYIWLQEKLIHNAVAWRVWFETDTFGSAANGVR